MRRSSLARLKDQIAALKPAGFASTAERVGFGVEAIDRALNGGLKRRALHEFEPESWPDGPAALGVMLGLAQRAAESQPVMVLQQRFLDGENGQLHGPGLAQFGLDPAQFVLFRAQRGEEMLRAGLEAARCAGLGSVLMVLTGQGLRDWLTVSRKFSLACERSGVPLFLLHAGGAPKASAAATRWRIRAVPSVPREAQAPGAMRVSASLMRQRGGAADGRWIVEWNRDDRIFASSTPRLITRSRAMPALPRPVVSTSGGGSGEARKAG